MSIKEMNMKMKFAFLSLAGMIALAGCTVYLPTPPGMSSTEVSPNVQIVGTVEGESQSSNVFGFGPFGDHSLRAALQDALSKRGGDALINVSIDQSSTSFGPFYRVNRTMVMGTAVKYMK